MYLITAYCIACHAAYLGSKVVVSLYALELGASATEVGLLGGLLFLFPLLLSWPIGALADRRGARGILES